MNGRRSQEFPELANRARVGRSGPRKKTGCLICRRRKVRCDETKPSCKRCERLQVSCVYHQPPRTADSISVSLEKQQSPLGNGDSEQQDAICLANSLQQVPLLTADQSSRTRTQFEPPSFPAAPGITENTQNQDERAGILDFQNTPAFNFQALDTSFLFSEFSGGLDHLFSETSQLQNTPSGFEDCSQSFATDLQRDFATVPPSYGIRLQQHFMSLVSLPKLIQSVDCDWNDVRLIILKMAETSDSLSNAIFAFSDAHLSITEGCQPEYAANYYDRASLALENAMNEKVEGEELKASFAAVLFLIYVELLVPIQSSFRPPHYHLRSTHAMIRKHKSRLASWRGIGSRIITWLVLFDSKATLAGREGELLQDIELTMANNDLDAADKGLKSPSYIDILYGTLNGECLRFYLKTEEFTRRIIEIDRWHRPRGSLNDELEVLQIGKGIDASMDAHWASRPILMDHAVYPQNLVPLLQEPLAARLCESVRGYLANFHAHRIYLHRVAFRKYPREEKVDRAMETILTLAKVDMGDDSVLPSAFQWPLFMCGLEANGCDRKWIDSALTRMIEAKDHDHAGAERALQVLRVMSSRQDAGDQVVDFITVRNELFQGSLSVI